MIATQLAVSESVTVIGVAPMDQDLVRDLGRVLVSYDAGRAERVRELSPSVAAVLDATGKGELADAISLAGGPARVMTLADEHVAELGVASRCQHRTAHPTRSIRTHALLAAGALRLRRERQVVPAGLELRVVLDNLSAYSAPPVTDWLAHPKRARWHLHFTPTSATWLNLVEGWFAQLTNKRLRDGSVDSAPALVEAIDIWASHRNDDPQPFLWPTTAKAIIKKVKRGRTALTHQTKTATDHEFVRWSGR